MRKAIGWTALIIGIIFAALFLFARTPDTDPTAMRATYARPGDRFVALENGLTVHLRASGPRDAPVLMLLHGSNASLATWQPWADRLDGRYRVVRYDQQGHGLTGPSPTRDYSAAAFANTLERVRAKLGLDRFVLAGNSMGGRVALAYALAHPDHLEALILVDASGAPSTGKTSLPIGFRLARIPVIRDLMLSITPRRLVAKSLHQAVFNQAIVTDAMIDRYWELNRYPGNRQATIDYFARTPVAVTAAEMKRLTIPTLILWGARDTLLPKSSANWLTQHIPNSRAIVYPRTGHLPMEERPDRSAADVTAFLESLPKPAKEDLRGGSR